ncbi:DUF2065 domain-containing protein [bacterium]|nr:DUF2065 domain-containing protein [bacterium]
MAWADLLRALALVLVIEGLMPFLMPQRWREVMQRMATQDDRSLRIIGLVSIGAGLLVLQVAK